MMPASNTDYVQEYIVRTKTNYSFINRVVGSKKDRRHGPFEVTELINSMVGLLIIPKERYLNQVTDNLIDQGLLGKMIQCIQKDDYSDSTLKGIVKHMRNAVAHDRIEFHAEKQPRNGAPLIIHSITFKDQDDANRPSKYFEIDIKVNLLDEFLFAFADGILTLIP